MPPSTWWRQYVATTSGHSQRVHPAAWKSWRVPRSGWRAVAVFNSRAKQQLFRLKAVYHHADVSRLLNELVDEQLHAADRRPAHDVHELMCQTARLQRVDHWVSGPSCNQSDRRRPIFTRCRRSCRKATIRPTMTFGRPRATSLTISTLWSTWSNAL